MPDVTASHIASKKRIGTLNDKPVVELVTDGGLYLVVAAGRNGVETLGSGPHRAVARHIAKKREPDMRITELSKSDWLDDASVQSVLPKYERLTDALRAAEASLR